MMGYNTTILMGRMTRELELRRTPPRASDSLRNFPNMRRVPAATQRSGHSGEIGLAKR